MAMVNIYDGNRCLFWDDLWLNHVPKHNFPELFSFAKTKHISVQTALEVGGPATATQNLTEAGKTD